MKSSRPATFLLCACLLASAMVAETKSKTPSGTPGTVPPTSRMIATPSPDAASGGSVPSGKLISSEMSGRDLEFFTAVVEAGREQAFLIALLKEKASSGQIKALADALTTTQEEENRHIARLAALKGWDVSLEPGAAQKKAGSELGKLSGSNFDKAVMDKLAAATAQAMKAYQGAAQTADPEIKTFAAQMVPLAEEKRHVIEKMTGAGSKAAAQLFRQGAASSATPAATPAGQGAPAATPAATPDATPQGKGKSKGKHPATPAPTPTPAASAPPVATPPGQSALAAPAANLPAILPPKAKAVSLKLTPAPVAQ